MFGLMPLIQAVQIIMSSVFLPLETLLLLNILVLFQAKIMITV